MLRDYEVRNGDNCSWATSAGQQKIIVLKSNIPSGKCDEGIFNDPLELTGQKYGEAGKYLVKTRRNARTDQTWISHMSNTISGEPGSAFYMGTPDGRTFCTQQFIVPQFSPLKRSPVLNAIANLIGFKGQHLSSFDIREAIQAPAKEVWAAALPLDLMDSILISDALEDAFTAKLYNCLLYTSPSPRDRQKSRMPSSA